MVEESNVLHLKLVAGENDAVLVDKVRFKAGFREPCEPVHSSSYCDYVRLCLEIGRDIRKKKKMMINIKIECGG